MAQLTRSTHDRVIAGICSGIAAHYKTDAWLVRVGFIILAFFGGLGIVIYLFLAALLPETAHSTTLAQEVDEHMRRSNSHSHRAIGLFIMLIGLLFLFDNFFPGVGIAQLWPLLIIALGIFVLLRGHDRK